MDSEVNLKKDVSARIKLARKTLKLTQDGLCQRSGMPLPSLKEYESGKQLPGAKALSMLMRAGMAPAWVLTGSGEMFCKPAEAAGIVIAGAIRQSGLTIEEVVARLDIDVIELLGYLEGRVFPEEALLVRVSEVTGYPLEKLQDARDIGNSLAQIVVMHASVKSGLHEKTEDVATSLSDDETYLLARYREADDKGKTLLRRIGEAVSNPSLKAWFDAGLALSEAATIFEKLR